MTAPFNVFHRTNIWLKNNGVPETCLSLCDSTNDLAKQGAFNDPSLCVYLADHQAHGRGRGDHSWSSPPSGCGLLASWSFELTYPPQHLTAPMVGLQLYRAVTKMWPELNWSLKAPNDLCLEGKKVAGILVESVSNGSSYRLIVGLGLNVLDAPASMDSATCIQQHLNTPLSIAAWDEFLHILHQALCKASELSGHTWMPEELRHELANAVRRHATGHGLVSITAEGDLVYGDHSISWHML